VESLLGIILGYAFWLVVSATLGASLTGESSSSVTFAIILSSIATIGISTGVQRFLGKALGNNNQAVFAAISKFALVFTILTMVVSSVAVIFLSDLIVQIFHVSASMILVIILTSVFYSVTQSLRAAIISDSKTRILVVVLIASSVIRFASLIPVYLTNLGSEGITLSYLSFYIASALLSLFFLRKYIFTGKFNTKLFNTRAILTSSLSGWLPNAIYVIGTQSGLLFILSISGATEAGLYFIAFSIFSAVSALPMSLLAMSYPVMSGMKEGQERLLWQALRLGLFSTVPISLAIAVNPASVLSLFGKEFVGGQLILSLLSICLIPVEINRGITNLVYANARYKQVLVLGIFPSITRLTSYIILVPLYGNIGAAMAFLLGSFVGLAVAMAIVLKNHYVFPNRNLIMIGVIPGVLAGIFYFVNIHPVLSSLSIILGSYFLLARFHAVTYEEIAGGIQTIFINQNHIRRPLLLIAKAIFAK